MNRICTILLTLSTLLLIGCNTMRGVSSASRWSYDPSNGQIVDQQAHIQWHFTDNPSTEQNASDFSYGARLVTAADYETYLGKKYVKSIVRDLPFRPDSVTIACYVLIASA